MTLDPCPFCGHEPAVITARIGVGTLHAVACLTTGHTAGTGWRTSAEDATRDWNARALPLKRVPQLTTLVANPLAVGMSTKP
jgi:Lar family restriction alleviation protein